MNNVQRNVFFKITKLTFEKKHAFTSHQNKKTKKILIFKWKKFENFFLIRLESMDNYSNFSLNDTGHYAAFKTYTTIEVTILSILFCFALIGNSLVIIKLVFFGKKNPLFNKNSQSRLIDEIDRKTYRVS